MAAFQAARLSGGTALAVAMLLAVGGVAVARTVEVADDHRQATDDRREIAATQAAFHATTAALVHDLDALRDRAPAGWTTPLADVTGLIRPDGARAIVLVDARGTPPSKLAGTLPAGFSPATLATDARAALEVSRDSGDPRGALLPSGDVAVAVPRYFFAGSIVTTGDRRTHIAGWMVALVSPPTVVSSLHASGGSTLALAVGGAGVVGRAGMSRRAVQSTELVAGQPWQLTLTPRPANRRSPGTAAALLLGLAAATGVLLVHRRGARAVAAASSSAEALERETRTVAELSPLLQQSLDLAEVLPAVAVRLSDEFGLDRFAVELIGESGTFVDVFALGARPSEEARDVSVAVDRDGLPAGVEAALPLLRADRTIGRLRFSARRRLLPTQLDTLRAAADLIAVATYNVELYEREQSTVRRLQELDRLKDAFLGTISHELRTPITAIGGFVRLLVDRWPQLSTDERHDFLNRVSRNTASLGLLVDDLLDFARLERQAWSTVPVEVRLDGLLAAIVAQLGPALGDREIRTDLEPDVAALADAGALERVVANLLTNAAKFSPAGSPVQVTLRRDGPWARIVVADQGPGIAAEDRLRVFNRFYRGDSQVARSTRGAGIGLAVVHELVAQMDGEIAVEDRVPHGTAMVVRLPLARAVHPDPVTHAARSAP